MFWYCVCVTAASAAPSINQRARRIDDTCLKRPSLICYDQIMLLPSLLRTSTFCDVRIFFSRARSFVHTVNVVYQCTIVVWIDIQCNSHVHGHAVLKMSVSQLPYEILANCVEICDEWKCSAFLPASSLWLLYCAKILNTAYEMINMSVVHADGLLSRTSCLSTTVLARDKSKTTSWNLLHVMLFMNPDLRVTFGPAAQRRRSHASKVSEWVCNLLIFTRWLDDMLQSRPHTLILISSDGQELTKTLLTKSLSIFFYLKQ